MRIALAGVCAGALAGAALAAPGDPVVIPEGAAVRVAPRADAPVLKQVGEDRQAIEQARREGWVEVEIPDLLVRGWLPIAGLAPSSQTEASPAVPRPRLKARGTEAPALPPDPAAAHREPAGAPSAPPAKPQVGEGLAADGGRLARLLEPPPPGLAVEPPPSAGKLDAIERFRASVRYLEARRGSPALFAAVDPLRAGAVRVTATEDWLALGGLPGGGVSGVRRPPRQARRTGQRPVRVR